MKRSMQRFATARSSHLNGARAATLAIGLAAVFAGVSIAPDTARAEQLAPWCAQFGAQTGSYDCSYYTFEQCMATVRGVGGFCNRNPRAPYVDPRPRRQRDRW
jgi:uncharacterized protein DUF3551